MNTPASPTLSRPRHGSLPSPFPSVLLAWLLAIGSWLLAHGAQAPSTPTKRPVVLATFTPLHSWTLNVAGPDADVELLLPGDVGPHDFQLKPQDLRRIRKADVIIANGLGVESWLDKAIRNNARDAAKKVVRVTDGLPKEQFIYHLPELELADPKKGSGSGHGHGHGHDHDHDHEAAGEVPNPHVWLDPVLARHAVSNIVGALCAADPAHRAAYTARGEAYAARLESLHRDMTAALSPHAGKPIVTFHDAFPYLCRRYGLELVGVVEEVPAVDPSPKYLARLSAAIRSRKVRVVFSEPQFNPRLVRQLSKDLGIRVAELDVLETGKPGAAFYEEGMRRNLKALVESLP